MQTDYWGGTDAWFRPSGEPYVELKGDLEIRFGLQSAVGRKNAQPEGVAAGFCAGDELGRMCFGWDVKPDSVRKTDGWAPLRSGNVRIRLEGVGTDAPVTATIYDEEPGQQLDRQVGWPALATGTKLRFSPAVVSYTDDPQGIEVVITDWKL